MGRLQTAGASIPRPPTVRVDTLPPILHPGDSTAQAQSERRTGR